MLIVNLFHFPKILNMRYSGSLTLIIFTQRVIGKYFGDSEIFVSCRIF